MKADFLLLEGKIALHDGKLDEALKILSEANKLEYRGMKPDTLKTYALILARIGSIQESYNTAIHAINAYNELITERPGRYSFHYSLGLAQATVAIITQKKKDRYLSLAIESYQYAIKLCHEPGVIRYQQLQLEYLIPLDTDGVLSPIFELLKEFENETV